MKATQDKSIKRNLSHLCKVCYNSTNTCYNFGGICCRGCTAFFRRSVRNYQEYDCKSDPVCCGNTAVFDVTASHACKKCRFDRCIKIGMQPGYVRDPHGAFKGFEEQPRQSVSPVTPPTPIRATVPNKMPLLSKMSKIVQFQYEHLKKCHSEHASTNESLETFLDSRHCFEADALIYRRMLNVIPYVCDLSEESKEKLFQSSISLYVVLMHAINNSHYIFSDNYINLDDKKLAQMTTEFMSKVKNVLSYATDDLFKTCEDLAAVILIVLIHTNDKDKSDPEIPAVMKLLKKVWNELDVHYKETQRNSSLWGNLILFLSSLEALTDEYLRFLRYLDFHLANQAYDTLAAARRNQEEIDVSVENV
ncbi:hypothetical protein L596_022824 [Steinernema carpocapsae]|uniref:Nuclear receptor domain-containing protein n=1 Tax=Steinernema carpocapsae TaxID=34508 RepID=A0A4U5MPJ9_STECR|nr:hypothetical protein L596_022824 [Steinernema carpocapsae]